jgi:hypothetical protein
MHISWNMIVGRIQSAVISFKTLPPAFILAAAASNEFEVHLLAIGACVQCTPHNSACFIIVSPVWLLELITQVEACLQVPVDGQHRK